MAEALSTHIRTLTYSLPVSTKARALAAVFSDWPTFDKRGLSAGGLTPSAAVLPDRGVYDDSALTPRPIDSSWWTDGRDGYVLWEVAEYECPMVVVVRAKNKPERKAIMLAIEESFVQTGEPTTVPLPSVSIAPQRFRPRPESPIRYGLILALPGYYNQRVRFTLIAQQLLDSEELAASNRWMCQVEIIASGTVLVLRRAPALRASVVLKVDGDVDNR